MKLLFVRHGLSEGHFSNDQELDFERTLTSEGRKALHKSFKSLKRIRPQIDVIFTSPLARAVETAEILWEHNQDADLELMSDLDILDHPRHLVEYISFLPTRGLYAFVGHDPHLTKVIAALLALHPEHDFMNLKKGGLCLLEGGMWEGFKMELLLSPKVMFSIQS
jgi:phosphohistidine phosphatase